MTVMDEIALFFGRAIMVVGGFALFAWLTMSLMDYIYHAFKCEKEFVTLVWRRHRKDGEGGE